MRMALQQASDNLLSVIEIALASKDIVVRRMAAIEARTRLATVQLEHLLPALRNDKSYLLRREYLHTVIERFPIRAETALAEALMDRQFTVREFARYHLRHRGKDNLADVYRQLLQSGQNPEVAIAGIGEMGTAQDIGAIRPFLSSVQAKLRAAAYDAVAMLLRDKALDLLLPALADPSFKVVKVAARSLEQQIQFVSLDALWQHLIAENRSAVKLRIWRLIEQASFWPALPYLIEAAASDVQLLARFWLFMERKMNRVFTRPTDSEYLAIQEKLNAAQPRFDTDLCAELRKWLRIRKEN